MSHSTGSWIVPDSVLVRTAISHWMVSFTVDSTVTSVVQLLYYPEWKVVVIEWKYSLGWVAIVDV